MQSNNNFKLSRESAAEKIGISLRTLDRYIKNGKLGYVKVEEEGVMRILVSEEGVEELINRKNKRKKSTVGAGESQKPENNAQEGLQPGQEEKSSQNQNFVQNDGVAEVYRRLYEETNQRLGEANRRLEGANYRVGELEAQLKSSVPLLEYRETQDKAERLSQKVEKLNQEVAEGAVVNYRLTDEISQKNHQIELEKGRRVLYIVLLVFFVFLGSLALFWQNLT